MAKELKCIQLTGDHGTRAEIIPKSLDEAGYKNSVSCWAGLVKCPNYGKSGPIALRIRAKALNITANGLGDFLLANMQTFYFDMKDGVPVRDRIGMQFMFNSEAIKYSKEMAERFRHERTHDEPDLAISVISEAGQEIHREVVFPADLKINPRQKSG